MKTKSTEYLIQVRTAQATESNWAIFGPDQLKSFKRARARDLNFTRWWCVGAVTGNLYASES